MSDYYTPKRSRGLYVPDAKTPFKLSRSKLEFFMECPRCFYLDRRLGIGRPPGFPFALNSAVDALLKKEFDMHRIAGNAHPLQAHYGIDAVPAARPELDAWRHNFTGVQYLHEPTNLLITGAIDDLWQNSAGEYIVVDYKSTSKEERIESLNKEWHISYKRQMEVYQWLLRKNGLTVSDLGYFVYCNGKTDREAFDARLEFEVTLVPYEGDDSWVEKAITKAHTCLVSPTPPEASERCDYCAYVEARRKTGY